MANTLTLIFAFLVICSCAYSYNFELSHELTHSILESHMNSPPKDLFKVWHFVFQKAYDINTEDGIKKYKTFKTNLADIKSHNANQVAETFSKGLNEFSDLSFEEFKIHFNIKPIDVGEISNEITKFNTENKFNLDDYKDDDDDQDDDDHDLHKKGTNAPGLSAISWLAKMTAIRNQGSCGSCWAFATTAMLEGKYFIKNPSSSNVWLSTQQLVDCDTSNNGCNGGWYTGAINYYITKMANLDSFYPYKAVKSTCKYSSTNGKKLGVTGYLRGSTLDTTYNLLKTGPVAVAVAVGSSFQSYRTGIFNPGTCPTTGVNHAVVAIGYANDASNNGYWVLRNSWGTSWGESGYMRVYALATGNDCYVRSYGFQGAM